MRPNTVAFSAQAATSLIPPDIPIVLIKPELSFSRRGSLCCWAMSQGALTVATRRCMVFSLSTKWWESRNRRFGSFSRSI
ncbi:MAG: hypothetical protein P8077_02610, partial [Gammaproteobacteria bacterium]